MALLASTVFAGAGNDSAAIDTTGATLLVIMVIRGPGSGFVAPTDSNGNTWTPTTRYTASFNGGQQWYYVDVSPTVGTGHTFQMPSGDTPGGVVMAFSGTAPSGSFDVETGSSVDQSFPFNTGSPIAPTKARNLILAGMSAFPMDSLPTIDSGFSGLVGETAVLGTNWGVAVAYLEQAGTASQDPTWTAGAGANNGGFGLLASFELEAGVVIDDVDPALLTDGMTGIVITGSGF